MQNFEIPLQKRKSKFILYILAAFVCVFAVISFVANMIMKEFSWWNFAIGILFLFGAGLILSRLYVYVTSKQLKLVIETNGKKMTFYNKNESGKVFNKSEDFKLSNLGKFYVVKERTRYMMTNYSFAFESKGAKTSIFKKEVDAFPSLFEATEDDRNRVLAFVQESAPHIELGYENSWQKAMRNKS